MKPTVANYQDSTGVQLSTRYQILDHSFRQTVIVCEVPLIRNQVAKVSAPLQSSMSAFVRLMCATYSLDPGKLVLVLSYVPLEQVPYCGQGQLMQVSWEGWTPSLFGAELRGVHWYHAPDQLLHQWQQLATRA
ncbi:hypothetical protein KLP40_14885 [Hymenobacter sp. NST-14]|uniref:hypothetical protein n=1 Tax=Hymenobacter piscis TaxID=2839984 RepID=UPI001C020769|nr:hypothetical protein [Hymenobacter piscis]MBT9394455.1 hypothetical protein [Hymenobacter piscis]